MKPSADVASAGHARACRRAIPIARWLASIPRRFLPRWVADERVFASIRNRADFQALFADRE